MNAMINVVYNPFTIDQNIYVYKDGNCIYQTAVDITRVSDAVNGLRKQYDIEHVNLCGNKDYLEKFKAEMKTTFDNDFCEITIVEK